MTPRAVVVAAVLLVSASASACGKVDLAASDTALVDASTSRQQQNLSGPTVINPTPTPAPTYNPPLQMGQLTAELTSFDKPLLRIYGTSVAHITVKNQTQVPLKGTVKVAFTSDGTVSPDHTQTKSVAIDPNSAQTFDLEEKGWFLNDASVSVQTQPPGGSTGFGQSIDGAGASIYGRPPGS